MTLLVPALLAISLGAATAPPAPPAPTKLAVIDLDSPTNMFGLAGQVTREILQEAKNQKLEVITPDELKTRMDQKSYNSLIKCGAKPGCVASALSAYGEIARAVSGTLNRDEKNYKLTITLTDVRTGELVADVDRSVLIASRRFQKDMEQAIPGLLRGEKEARGTLKITTAVKNVTVTLNGELLGTAPVTVQRKQGKYELVLTKSKYLEVKRLVAIEADKTTEEDIRMILMPGETDKDTLPPLVRKDADAAQEAPGFSFSVPTYLAGGVAIAALAVGAGFGFKAASVDKALVNGFNSTTMVYAGTRADALGVQRDALIANIGFGIAGAAAIATGVLVFLDIRRANAEAEPLRVVPTATPGGGGLMLGGSF